MKPDKKQLKKNYQQEPRAIGVLLIRNNRNDKVFLAAGPDMNGLLNRHKFQLEHGGHPNKLLQADWNSQGSQDFAFEIVDELRPAAGVEFDYRREVSALEDLWLEKLQPFDDAGYNVRKLTRAQRLSRIANKETS
ncbi:MAG TPA: GIY-YIG nuclease family protein [Pyrinomonadaceae bacterium]|nr:GIY-YIG nuclease family protein [Pyrinomonadaceae bacterium]